MAIGFPYDVGSLVQAGLGSNALLGSVLPTPGQSFSTIPLSNDRLALYTLVVKDLAAPDQAINGLSYTFPISPSALSREFTAMTNIYDVQGSSKQFGVQRIIDQYGNSPPTFNIEGTTGWQRHSSDGFGLTGLESIAALKNIFDQYAQLNRDRQQQNNAVLFVMEFYDYFASEFWRVVPVGRQIVQQDQTRPLLFYYRFRFAATENLSDPPQDNSPDPVLDVLNTPQNQATSELSESLSTTLTNYAPETPGALVE